MKSINAVKKKNKTQKIQNKISEITIVAPIICKGTPIIFTHNSSDFSTKKIHKKEDIRNPKRTENRDIVAIGSSDSFVFLICSLINSTFLTFSNIAKFLDCY